MAESDPSRKSSETLTEISAIRGGPYILTIFKESEEQVRGILATNLSIYNDNDEKIFDESISLLDLIFIAKAISSYVVRDIKMMARMKDFKFAGSNDTKMEIAKDILEIGEELVSASKLYLSVDFYERPPEESEGLCSDTAPEDME